MADAQKNLPTYYLEGLLFVLLACHGAAIRFKGALYEVDMTQTFKNIDSLVDFQLVECATGQLKPLLEILTGGQKRKLCGQYFREALIRHLNRHLEMHLPLDWKDMSCEDQALHLAALYSKAMLQYQGKVGQVLHMELAPLVVFRTAAKLRATGQPVERFDFQGDPKEVGSMAPLVVHAAHGHGVHGLGCIPSCTGIDIMSESMF